MVKQWGLHHDGNSGRSQAMTATARSVARFPFSLAQTFFLRFSQSIRSKPSPIPAFG